MPDNFHLNKALMTTARRAEARLDLLAETFVEVDVLETLLQTPDHQVLFGRRGTGKTHVLNILKHIVESEGDLAIMVDMRTIASTGGLLSDANVPFNQRAALLLKDTIEAIETALDDYALLAAYERDDDFTSCLEALDHLADELTQVRIAGTVEAAEGRNDVNRNQSGLGAHLAIGGTPQLTFDATNSVDREEARSHQLTRTGTEEHHVHFGATQRSLAKVVELLPANRVRVLLDEWTDVPRELQPILAEFIRRCLLPVPGITVKIGAIEKRTNFVDRRGDVGDYIGFELGSDVAGDADLDDYFMGLHTDGRDQTFLEQMIFNHVRGADPTLVRGSTPTTLRERLFSERRAFVLLANAAAGVPRDALNILRIACQRAGRSVISFRLLRDAVRSWYTRDKLGAVSSDRATRESLDQLLKHVIGEAGNVCFLVRDAETDSRDLASLYDARLVHLVKRDIPSPSDVVLRYALFRIDLGAYIDLPPARVPRSATKYAQHADYPVMLFRAVTSPR